jgi:hypothetical protein
VTADFVAALMWLTTVALAVSTLMRIRRPIDIALLAPLSWLGLIAIPAMLPIFRGLSSAFHTEFVGPPRDNLFLSIALANVMFFALHRVLDHESFGNLRGRLGALIGGGLESDRGSRLVTQYWFAGLLLLAVGLALLHWWLMPKVPIWELVVGVDDPRQLSLDREQSAKLLQAPVLLKYVFTWNSRILLPILLCAAVLLRWRAAAAFVFVFGLLYIMSPLEKLPSMLFVLSPFVAMAIHERRRLWSPLLIAGLVLSLVPPWLITQSYPISNSIHETLSAPVVAHPQATEAVQPGASVPPQPGASVPPIPIVEPLAPYEPGATFNMAGALGTLTDLIIRRIGSGPIEVTYSWFQYFPLEHGGFLNGVGWAPWLALSPDRQSPANLVGLWAYYGHSGYDIASLSAYASFIADGWAEFGLVGVLLVCLALFLLLVLLELLGGFLASPFSVACYAPALLLVALIPPQGGVPALVFSLGVALSPLIWFAYVLSFRVLADGDSGRRAVREARVAVRP